MLNWFGKYSFLTAVWIADSVTPCAAMGSRITQRRRNPSLSGLVVGVVTGISEGASPRGPAGAPPPGPPRPPPLPPGAANNVADAANAVTNIEERMRLVFMRFLKGNDEGSMTKDESI